MLTASAKIFYQTLFLQVNVVCLESGHLLRDIFQVREIEISNIDLGEMGSTESSDILLLFCDKGFGEDCGFVFSRKMQSRGSQG